MKNTLRAPLALLVAVGSAGCGTNAPGGSSSGTAPDGGSPPLEVRVSPGEDARPVSPLIYGMNGAPSASRGAPATLVRFSGDLLPAYNWEANATNTGRLGGYANLGMTGADLPGAAAKAVLDAAAAAGATALIAVPIGDYVAADKNPGDVHGTGTDYLATRFRKNKPTKGSAFLASPDLADDSVYQDEFVAWAKGAAKGPVLFSLDNQPELWSEDDAEIHAAKATYDEVVTRNITYGKAIKAAWPGALVTGFVSYGWLGFMTLQNSDDAAKHGAFLDYYLDRMRAEETTGGQRAIDYLDIHWWPEAQGAGIRVISEDAGPEMVLARVQAPRSLWDSEYHETSWIDGALGGDTIHLLPRLRGSLDGHYPGTKLALSAWYYGGGGDISGAVATADVLGIFGRYGVDLAAIALTEGDESFTLAAFKAFRSYDGKGAQFGDVSVKATTNDLTGSSVYASTDAADPTRVVIVVLNKREEARALDLTVSGTTQYASCDVYAVTRAASEVVAGAPLGSVGQNGFSYSMPPMSISVLVPKR